MTTKRYHIALVVLHWFLALLMLVELGLGSTFLKHATNDLPEKMLALRNHMIAGNLILILTVIRFLVRLKTKHPAPAYRNDTTLDRLATVGHYGLYLLPALMAISGLVLAAETNLPSIVFGGVGSLPPSFSGYDARIVHGVIAKLLIALITGHVLAALYHQFVRKDGLFGRMSISRK